MQLLQRKKASAPFSKSRTNEEQKNLFAIGKIAKPIGVRGDVVVQGMTDNLARFKKLKRVHVGRSETVAIERSITHLAIDARGVRLGFESITDRTAAEKIVGSLLFVDEKDAIRLPEGTFFIHDIVGLNVADEDGNVVGVVKDVLRYPANDVYVIQHDGKELLLPAVKEFVKKIDPAAKTMIVHLIEGMEQSSNADEEDTDAD